MSKPMLWHIPVSHYSEKARWALAYKDVEHERRSPPPPSHMPIALVLTRGKHNTFPLLRLDDGPAIGDSTEIIEALEQRFPDPPLYPSDPAERRRASSSRTGSTRSLARRSACSPGTRSRATPSGSSSSRSPRRRFPVPERVRPVVAAGARTFVNVRYGVKSEEAADRARQSVVAALDKLESELDGSDHLVGDRFSVADLSAAALFYPLVLPPEGPSELADPPEAFERFRAPLKERPGFRWVEEMFRRHRGRSA